MTLGHAEHIGSLLRPPAVRAALAARTAGAVAAEDAAAIIGAHAEAAIERQIGLGFRSPTDGEFFRHDWFNDFHAALGGVRSLGRATYTFRSVLDGSEVEYEGEGYEATAETHLDRLLAAEETDLVVGYADGEVVPKVTIPSPSLITLTPASQTEEVRAALVRAYHEEARGLMDRGLQYLQLDDPWLISSGLIPGQEETSRYIFAQLAEVIGSLNPNLTVGVHICRGNFGSGGITEGGYGAVADRLFTTGADRLFLELDDDRSGTIAEALAPYRGSRAEEEGADVALGLVSTKRPTLEDPELLLRRLDEATRYVDAECLVLSTQCGFESSDAGANLLTEEQQWLKLENLARTAERFWR